MEIDIRTNQHLLNWLDQMGYSVKGMPRELVEGMFLREAAERRVTAQRLAQLVMEQRAARPHGASAFTARRA